MKRYFSSCLLLLLASCYNPKAHSRFLSDKQDVWIDGYAAKNKGNKVKKGLVYCRANVKKDGSADPVCFKARFEKSALEPSSNKAQ